MLLIQKMNCLNGLFSGPFIPYFFYLGVRCLSIHQTEFLLRYRQLTNER
nr:MAG TPA: gamma-secretase-activating protein [Caudoviricetes sp.]